MNPNLDLVPAVEATAMPGPAWLFHVLLIFTFFLHAIFMNLTLGGTLMAAIAQFAARGPADARGVFARRIMNVNTYGISLTITTGIAPLLFVQMLYQQYFYSATILIGGVWLAFLLFLMLGYYAAYVYKFKGDRAAAGGAGWLFLSAFLFLMIAMVHVAVNLIHSQPETWATIAAHPWSILSDPTYFPRLLHFLLAALGFTGLVTSWWATRRAAAGQEVELNTQIARFGWRWALWTTALQLVDGFVLMFVLPRPVLLGFMRGGAVTLVPLTLSILLAIGLLMMLSRVSNPVERSSTVSGTLATMLLTIGVMSITRHQVRELYLQPISSHFELVSAPQWGNFVLFALLLVAGLATVAFMVRQVVNHRETGENAA